MFDVINVLLRNGNVIGRNGDVFRRNGGLRDIAKRSLTCRGRVIGTTEGGRGFEGYRL